MADITQPISFLIGTERAIALDAITQPPQAQAGQTQLPDYVTVEPVEDGDSNVTLQVLPPFSDANANIQYAAEIANRVCITTAYDNSYFALRSRERKGYEDITAANRYACGYYAQFQQAQQQSTQSVMPVTVDLGQGNTLQMPLGEIEQLGKKPSTPGTSPVSVNVIIGDKTESVYIPQEDYTTLVERATTGASTESESGWTSYIPWVVAVGGLFAAGFGLRGKRTAERNLASERDISESLAERIKEVGEGLDVERAAGGSGPAPANTPLEPLNPGNPHNLRGQAEAFLEKRAAERVGEADAAATHAMVSARQKLINRLQAKGPERLEKESDRLTMEIATLPEGKAKEAKVTRKQLVDEAINQLEEAGVLAKIGFYAKQHPFKFLFGWVLGFGGVIFTAYQMLTGGLDSVIPPQGAEPSAPAKPAAEPVAPAAAPTPAAEAPPAEPAPTAQ